MKNDIQLKHDVLARLERECHLGDDEIGVEVHHGVVKLAGRVCDYATMQRVEFVARHVEDVTTVLMDIDIAAAPTARRSGRGGARLIAIA